MAISALPKNWTAPVPSTSRLTPPISARPLLPVSQSYLTYVHLHTTHNLDFAAHDAHHASIQASLPSGDVVEDDLGVGDEEETDELLNLDPKEWKKQDHYAVLGLSHLRYKATAAQIKIAHRKKVLKHHPDKKAGSVSASNATTNG